MPTAIDSRIDSSALPEKNARVLVIGGGAREHALADTLSKSESVSNVYTAPGNAGTAWGRRCENVPLAATDIPALVQWATAHQIHLTVVGPEAPLVVGIVDAFRQAGLPIFGPDQFAAQLEGSKGYAKKLMQQCGVPTPAAEMFTHPEEAIEYSRQRPYPQVIKADGLAAGKGVMIVQNIDEARDAIYALWALQEPSKEKAARAAILVEQHINGFERSIIALVADQDIVMLPPAQDYKRRFAGNRGPNTGGMGALCPAALPKDWEERIAQTVFSPILKQLSEQGHPYYGFLYAGLMCTVDHQQEPQDFYVLEFNVRMGDPETQVILPRLKTDLYRLLRSALLGTLGQEPPVEWDSRRAVGMVLCGEDYPEHALKPTPISGALRHQPADGIWVYHASTTGSASEGFTVQGGRLVTVTALASSSAQARVNALAHLEHIYCAGTSYREDIGNDV